MLIAFFQILLNYLCEFNEERSDVPAQLQVDHQNSFQNLEIDSFVGSVTLFKWRQAVFKLTMEIIDHTDDKVFVILKIFLFGRLILQGLYALKLVFGWLHFLVVLFCLDGAQAYENKIVDVTLFGKILFVTQICHDAVHYFPEASRILLNNAHFCSLFLQFYHIRLFLWIDRHNSHAVSSIKILVAAQKIIV